MTDMCVEDTNRLEIDVARMRTKSRNSRVGTQYRYYTEMNRNGSVFIINACGRCRMHVEDAIIEDSEESMQIYMYQNIHVL